MDVNDDNRQTPKAPILAFEGIDGSGKGTQARKLFDRLTADGANVSLISFPQYQQTFFGQRVGDFLNGEFGQLDELNPFLVSLLYSGDRFESRQKIFDAQRACDLVILDRYVPSNVAHQSAKTSAEQQTQLQDWIEHIEYEIFKVPRPTQVILLDTPVDVSQELIARKSPRDYTDQAADLQEADVPYLEKVRRVYLDLAATRDDWTIVPVSDDQGLKTIDEIATHVHQIANCLLDHKPASQA